MISPRLRAGLVITAVVIASAIAGAAVEHAVMQHRPGRDGGRRGGPPPEMDARRRGEMLDHMSRDLSLSPAQRAGIDSIFQRTDSSLRTIRRDMQPRLREVFEKSRVEINARLDSAQRVKFAARRPNGPPRDWH